MRPRDGLAGLLLGLGLGLGAAPPCLAEGGADSLTAVGGVANVTAFSAEYKAARETLPSAMMRYGHELTGRWSLAGTYFYSLRGTFSGYALGVVVDSRAVHESSGPLTNDGTRELRSVPKWLLRGTASAGLWHFLDTLERSSPRLGEKPQAPVQADLYGVALGGSIQRFVTETTSVGVDVLNVSSVAAAFSVNAMSFGLGLNWYY